MRRMYSLNQLQDIASKQAKLVKKDIATLVDADGNNRFIEGDITPATITGLSFSYAKWSLSGTHLMIVLAGTVVANTTISDNTSLASVDVPQWILSKIYPISSSSVENKDVYSYKENAPWTTETFKVSLAKYDDRLRINNIFGTQTLENNGAFRIAFDLLIDNE